MSCKPPFPVGTAVRDTASDRIGLVMDHQGPHLQLRPLGGGREWDADPSLVAPLTPAELLSARVAEANARSRRQACLPSDHHPCATPWHDMARRSNL